MNNPNARRKNVHQFKEPARQDPYRSQCKPQGTPECPVCESVSIQGRWVSPTQRKALGHSILVTSELKCPACRQQEDHFALGVIELTGENWKKNKEMVMNTIQNTQEIARNRNDQERILWISDDPNGITKVYVTLPELARQIGRVLENSFQGKSEFEHSTEEPYLRVRWQSDQSHMRHSPGAAFPPQEKPNSNDQREHKSKSFRTRSRKAG